jgi:Holliday junction DNA helicase RuvA
VYDYLEGRLAERRATRAVVEVGGVGYDLAVPLGAEFVAERASSDGKSVRVWTHLVVREDAHLLFGFPDRRTREIFRLLLQVRGVGPTVALALLSHMSGDALLEAILAQDAAALTRVRGIGQKTAEQILLDLRDKAPRLIGSAAGDALVPRPPATGAVDDAVRALTSIGYSDKEAKKSVERAAKKVDPKDLELLVRAALQE